ncbi:MAG: DUF262 domain-containing protein [Bacteroidales bacterium]|nr:DUF262 domain-containing protein [Bacteroidales bacterium]
MEGNRLLEIKHVADLLTMRFNIPNYQRGYRWERKHVEALLDDLLDFSKNIKEYPKGKFYCIQPLAVVENTQIGTKDKPIYDVVDGQQRLTTLYLLLSFLEKAREDIYSGSLKDAIFTLQYETRDSNFFDEKKFKTTDENDAIDNIDFFYMTRAYNVIKEWFDKTGTTKSLILKCLIPEEYTLVTDENDEVKEQNDTLNDVRFIWYKVPVSKAEESMEVFSQLNYGKTQLTSTELVKALLFQCDIYTQNKDVLQEIAFRRSCEWDAMEKQLQNPFMWSMLMQEDLPSHITIVFSLVCNELYKELQGKIIGYKLQEDAEDFIYQVCNKYLSLSNDYAKNVDYIWNKVQKTYTALYNWYKNSDFYHLIGLLVWLYEFKEKKAFTKQKRYELIQELIGLYLSDITDAFENKLKEKIASIIYVEETKSTKEGKIPWGLSRINYHDSADSLIKILVTFNVEDIRKNQEESSLFPFHLLREQKITSLEHIHPQHLDIDSIDLKTLQKWVEVKEENLASMDKKEIYESDIIQLKEYLENPNNYKDNKNAALSIIDKIDKEFDDLANMSEEQMHTLYNMALVDKDTNAALSNNLLDVKRTILKKRQTEDSMYILPATKKVFNKYYSDSKILNESPKLWTKPDRNKYFEAIKQVYTDFISHKTTK